MRINLLKEIYQQNYQAILQVGELDTMLQYTLYTLQNQQHQQNQKIQPLATG